MLVQQPQRHNAIRGYYTIDPSLDDPTEALQPIATQLCGVSHLEGEARVVSANIDYELSNLASSAATREWYVENLTSSAAGADVDDPLHLIDTHLPFIAEGWDDSSREEFSARIGRSLIGNIEQMHGDERSNPRGRISELMTSYVLNCSGIEGVYALPSYARQERSRVKVDDKNYNWDLTVISTGEEVEAGEYRVQIKARQSRFMHKHCTHPGIIMLTASEALGVKMGCPSQVMELYRTVRYNRPGSSGDERLKIIRANMLAKLAAQYPI